MHESQHPDGSVDGVDRWITALATLAPDQTPTSRPADPAVVAHLETQLGVRLDPGHRRLLLTQDGWEPTAPVAARLGPLKLASAAWLARAPHTFSGPRLEPFTGPETTQALRDLGVRDERWLCIAVDGFYGASYVMPVRDAQVGPEVITVAGWVEEDTFVGQVYPTMDAFLVAMTTQAERSAARAEEKARAAAAVAAAWNVMPTMVIRGLPADIPTLARGLTQLVAAISQGFPGSEWLVNGRPCADADALADWMAGSLKAGPSGGQLLYVATTLARTNGQTWQVSVRRAWPSSPDDCVLVMLRSAAGRPVSVFEVERLISAAIETFAPESIAAASVAANQAATAQQIPQPTGYRVWLRADQVVSPSAQGGTRGMQLRPLAGGWLLSAADDWPAERAVAECHALVARLEG